ncbi:hypothetical protein SALBM217S_08241 [Streptomyces griseoloalbus]
MLQLLNLDGLSWIFAHVQALPVGHGRLILEPEASA